jgi:hypothetical protein
MQFLIRHWLFPCVTVHLGRGVVCGRRSQSCCITPIGWLICCLNASQDEALIVGADQSGRGVIDKFDD